MLKLTKSAANKVQDAATLSGVGELSLRFAARRIPDGSIEYIMGFDEAKDEDIRYKSEGVDIIMDPEYLPLLNETVMDFVELEPGAPQFIFLNPKDPGYVPPKED